MVCGRHDISPTHLLAVILTVDLASPPVPHFTNATPSYAPDDMSTAINHATFRACADSKDKYTCPRDGCWHGNQ